MARFYTIQRFVRKLGSKGRAVASFAKCPAERARSLLSKKATKLETGMSQTWEEGTVQQNSKGQKLPSPVFYGNIHVKNANGLK